MSLFVWSLEQASLLLTRLTRLTPRKRGGGAEEGEEEEKEERERERD